MEIESSLHASDFRFHESGSITTDGFVFINTDPCVLFTEREFGGDSQILEPGEYTSSSIPGSVGSVFVGVGFQVTLFSGDHFSGYSTVVRGDGIRVGQHLDGGVSSLKVEAIQDA
ncbi:hypothetical protein [Streptomyces sp. WM6378]|uniref:hypothetical protein n=1 Tax=Streptomyces sp. WM6378 TaxID=1415557 RepID=UPI0006AE5CA6|nr:hypothetical protein [Streptomyces sp. WM6378]KOU50083.1 hypothetical protein ADK54_09940 [Streptomyces sp. WM6378]